jgi:hypothetical protein
MNQHLTRLFYAALASTALAHVGLLAVQGFAVAGLEMSWQLETFAALAGLEVFAGTSAFILHRVRAHMAAATLRQTGYYTVNESNSVGGYE